LLAKRARLTLDAGCEVPAARIALASLRPAQHLNERLWLHDVLRQE